MSHLSLRPQNIDKDTWYYEEPSGLFFYHDAGRQNPEQFKLTWRKLKASLRRKKMDELIHPRKKRIQHHSTQE